jgi:hypothetical protein
MNFDQTRETVEPDNLIASVGIIRGWTSFIRQHPEVFDEKDISAEPYMSRACALLIDSFQGTPNANTSIYTCDVADTELVAKIRTYFSFAMSRGSARDRGVPTALENIILKLPSILTTT